MYLYHEPIKGDVRKFKIIDFIPDVDVPDVFIYVMSTSGLESYQIPNKVYPDGSYFLTGVGSFHFETEEWKIKYQNSLSLRVAQGQIKVYFVSPMKKGKVNTRALVIDDNGSAYHTLIPTFPTPRLGQSYMKLRMDLTVVSLIHVTDLYDKVMEARRADPSL